MTMSRDYSAENAQFYDAVEAEGWLSILEKTTPLEGAIQYVGTKNSKRFDICPNHSCSEHKLWPKTKGGKPTGNFVLFDDANHTGAGYCHKCRTRFSRFDIIMSFNNCDFPAAANEVKHAIGFRPDPNYVPKANTKKNVGIAAPKEPTPSELEDSKRLIKKMNDAWEQSVFLNNDIALPAAKYFAKRGITTLHGMMKKEVKFHPAMPFFIPISHPSEDREPEDALAREKLISYCKNHWAFSGFIEKEIDNVRAPVNANMGNHPCLLLMVRTKYGEPKRLHRIFLDKEGEKADFSKAGFEVKKMMPGGVGLEVTGCACYIDDVSPVVGVGEGFETVLAVKHVSQLPMDCSINAGGLGNYQPRDGVKFVIIFEDKDASKTGEREAKKLEERLLHEGYSVVRLTPPMDLGSRKSVDWLDVLCEIGPYGFPEIVHRWREIVT